MADTPLFYYPRSLPEGAIIQLPEDTARHVAQVLRMKTGERIDLTDGAGTVARCSLHGVEKKRVAASISSVLQEQEPRPALHLAISFTKNAARNEWLLEKATELGVRRITPLITARGIRERVRTERWTAILISAMLQSKQSWLPQLAPPTPIAEILKGECPQRLIAHCMDEGDARASITQALKKGEDAQILIGPEGDFTAAEVSLAVEAGSVPVSLGANRLRTETAALAAITHFYLTNHAFTD